MITYGDNSKCYWWSAITSECLNILWLPWILFTDLDYSLGKFVSEACVNLLHSWIKTTTSDFDLLNLRKICSGWPYKAHFHLRQDNKRLCQLCQLFYFLQAADVNASDYQHYSQALRMYGSWLSETKSERPDNITTMYLIPAVEMAERSKNVQGLFSFLTVIVTLCHSSTLLLYDPVPKYYT